MKSVPPMSALSAPALQSLAQRHGLVVLDGDGLRFGAVVPPSAAVLREIAFSTGTHPTIVQIDSSALSEPIPAVPEPQALNGPQGHGEVERAWPVGSAVELADALLDVVSYHLRTTRVLLDFDSFVTEAYTYGSYGESSDVYQGETVRPTHVRLSAF